MHNRTGLNKQNHNCAFFIQMQNLRLTKGGIWINAYQIIYSADEDICIQ
jgi:hypothetical protein